MSQTLKNLFLSALTALLLCTPALADAPLQDPVPTEAADILQNGAFSGPQTLPDQAAPVADSWEQEARSLLISGWEAGWETIKGEPLKGTESYVLDVSSLDVYTPGEGAEESVRRKYDTFIDLLSRIVNDEPERLFYARTWALKDNGDTSWHDPYSDEQKGWKIRYVTLRYMEFSGLTGLAAEKRFSAAVEEAMGLLDGSMSEVEKLLVLYDHLILNCVYNYEVRMDQDAPTGRVYGAYGALVDHDAVCTGYANAGRVFHKRLGIPSLAEGSSAMGHAWNLLQLSDGSWYHADATWDDKWAEGWCRHNNFLLSDEAFRKTGHHDWSVGGTVYPCTSTRFESGWIFNDSRSSVYRRDGRYYAVKLGDPAVTYSVFVSDRLDSQGTDRNALGRDLHINIHHGTLWRDDCLYYIYWDNLTRVRTVAALQLDSCKYVQIGRVGPTEDCTIGLRYEDGNVILSDTDTGADRVDLGGVPVLPPQPGAAPPVKGRDDRFPVYYHNGSFYTLSLDQSSGGVLLTEGESLSGTGTERGLSYIDPGIYDIVWEGGWLYGLYRESGGSTKTLMAVQLDTGASVQVGEFGKNGSSWVCLRYEDGSIVPYDRSSGAALRGGFSLLPEPSEIICGIQVYDGGRSALLRREAEGETLWVAGYAGGRMTELRQGSGVFTVAGHLQPDMTVLPLAQAEGDAGSLKCILTGPGSVPVCPAVCVAVDGE